MRIFTTALVVICVAFMSYADSNAQIFDSQTSIAAASQMKITGTQRLINLIWLDKTTGTLTDSMAFTWGGNRMHRHYRFPYQSVTDYRGFDRFTPLEPLNLDYFKRRYLDIQADTMASYALAFGDTTFTKYAYEYDGADKLTRIEVLEDGLPNFEARSYYEITYNTAGKITDVVTYDDVTNDQVLNYVLTSTMKCTYNASGNLIQDSIYLNPPSTYGVTDYYQDAAGRDTMFLFRTGNTLSPLYKKRFEYNASGLLARVERYDVLGGPIDFYKSEVDSFGYDGVNSFPVFYTKYTPGFPNISWGQRRYYTLNSAGDVAHYLELQYNTASIPNSWDSTVGMHFFYNGYANADSLIMDRSISGPYEHGVAACHFRYDPIAPPAAVKKVMETATAISIYPNPARQSINLSIPSFKKGTRGTASVYDMQGRLIMTSGVIKSEQSMNISRLPAGMYLVQYSGGDGNVGTSRFVKE